MKASAKNLIILVAFGFLAPPAYPQTNCTGTYSYTISSDANTNIYTGIPGELECHPEDEPMHAKVVEDVPQREEGDDWWRLTDPPCNAQWIWKNSTGSSTPVEEVLFYMCFCTDSVIEACLELSADDEAEVELNGNHVGTHSTSFYTVSSWNIPTSYFNCGMNILTIRVKNTNGQYGGLIYCLHYSDTGGPDLRIRDNASDNGSIPTYPFWVSPDICVDAPPSYWNNCSTCPPGPIENAIAEPLPLTPINKVYVTVHNVGTCDAEDVEVRLYWADPAGGIPWPQKWNPTAPDHYVITSVPAGGSVCKTFNWTPPYDNTSHKCLLATAECCNDSLSTTYDHIVDKDNNIAQKNITVLYVSAPPPSPNPLAKSRKTRFVLNPMDTKGKRSMEISFIDAPKGVKITLEIPKSVEINVGVKDTHIKSPRKGCLGIFWRRDEWTASAVTNGDGSGTMRIPDFMVNQKVEVELKIQLPKNTKVNEFTIRITEKEGDKTIGGMDYLTR